MQKLIFILFTGVLLFLSSPSCNAQRIEQDSTGRYYACTNYDLHLQQKQHREFNKFLLYTGVMVGVLALNEASRGSNHNHEGFIPDHALRQYGSAFITVIGATLVVGIYQWQVHVKNEAGL